MLSRRYLNCRVPDSWAGLTTHHTRYNVLNEQLGSPGLRPDGARTMKERGRAVKLKIDVSEVTFVVSLAPAPKEFDKKQQTDNDGNLKWVTELIALGEAEDEGAEVIKVVTTGDKPKLSKSAPVSVVDLEAIPWVSKNRDKNGVAFRAAAIQPLKAAAK